jgi:hypothetical protein
MKILIACEYSGTVRDAFARKGHDATSCDLLPTMTPGKHYQGSVTDIIGDGWDMMIAHPPCTYLANSGVSWLNRIPGRWDQMRDGAEFFRLLLNAPIPKIAIENPVMHGYAKEIIGQTYTQTIQPWQFGEDASKRTCLWLKNLPALVPTDVLVKNRYANQTPSGQNNLGPSADRWKERSTTYQGIANAMAEQWG